MIAMGMKRHFYFHRFLAALTIFSFAFTQVLPAWALRPEGAASPTTKAGLEENLRGHPVPTGVGTVNLSGEVATLGDLVTYFSRHPTWTQTQGAPDEVAIPILVDLLAAAMQGEEDTPLPITRALLSPAQMVPLVLRLIAPGDQQLHETIDRQWTALQQQCALCASHILHENLEGTKRRDLTGHLFRDLIASIITAYDAKKLGRIPTRRVSPEAGHTEREVPTQTAYGVQVVGGLQGVRMESKADVLRSLAYLLPSTPDEQVDQLPVIHVRALGSPTGVPGNHFVAIQAVDLQNDRVHVLDNGESLTLSSRQFLRQYNPTGLILVSSDQQSTLESEGFKFQLPSEQELLQANGDCGTAAFKGDFPAGFHAPIGWALKSAERLLYRGADGGGVQVRYELNGQLNTRFYRVSYNSTTQVMTFRVADIGPDQQETVRYERSLSIMEATQQFGVTPDKVKRFMAKFLAELANKDEYKIDKNAKLIDVVTHFRWATHGESDIWGTHPHEARPSEVRRPNGAAVSAKTVTVAHNGIVYDYLELGIRLADVGHTFETGVDSERFAHLVWEIIDHEKPPTLLDAVRRALGRIQLNDTYGFQISSNNYPEEIVSARNESPIYLGISDQTARDPLGRQVHFFMTAADPKAILPHTTIFSTLIPDRAIVQVKNDRLGAVDLAGRPYFLVLPDGTVSAGQRVNGGMVPVPVAVQATEGPDTSQHITESLTAEQFKLASQNKLKVYTIVDGQIGAQAAGVILFQKGKDQPEVYDLKDYPDYTTKELYQSGQGIRNTVRKNTVQVPVCYIPRFGAQVQPGAVRTYRVADIMNQSHPIELPLTADQIARITGPEEGTELILKDGQYYFVKLIPGVPTPWYDTLMLPEFRGIHRWDQLREADRVWLVSVGSSYNSDLDGARFIRMYAHLPTEVLNSDEMRDDRDWGAQAAGSKKIAVLATTQSGTTAVTKAVMHKIQVASGKREASNAVFVNIADTNNPGSDITQPDFTQGEMNEGLPPEIGVLSTAAVSAQKVNKELFGMRLGIERRVLRPEEAHDRIQELLRISEEVDAVLKDKRIEGELRPIAEELVRANQCKVCYRGTARGTAHETGIKLEEGGEIHVTIYNMGTFLHGPAQLLQTSKVPVDVTASVKAEYDAMQGQITHTIHYSEPPKEVKRRGFPLLVFYIPTEGDEDIRGRLESNFQTVNSRGASVYIMTSKDYASQLVAKKAVVRAIGVPASEYTLTALGQKLALIVADVKNTQLAERIFARARAIQEHQTAELPANVSSREEWIRQALVDAYSEVVTFRENGWLAQVLHQEGIGFILSRINEAAQHPEDPALVGEARDSISKMVNFIDVAQPGKLAKSVTVEAGLEEVETTELTANEVTNQIRPSIGPWHTSEDTRSDWLILNQVRTWLTALGTAFDVRFGDPLGRQPALTEAPGPESRPSFQVRTIDNRRLSITPAYRVGLAQPQRCLFVYLSPDLRHSAQYWAIPVDAQTQARLLALHNEFIRPAGAVSPVEASILALSDKLLREQSIQFGYVEEPGLPVRTTLLIVGQPKTLMLHDILVHSVSMKGMNIHRAVTEDRPGDVGVDQVVVDASAEDLRKQGVLGEIQRRIATTFPSPAEIGLTAQLSSQGLSGTELDFCIEAFRRYQAEPAVTVSLRELQPGQTQVVAMCPLNPPSDVTIPLGEALDRAIIEQAKRQEQQITPPGVFYQEFRFPGQRPAAFIAIRLNLPQREIVTLGLVNTVEDTLQFYAGEPPAGPAIGWQFRLREELENRGRSEGEIGWYLDLCGRYRQEPGFYSAVQQLPDAQGLVFIVAVFPYQLPPREPEPVVGITQNVEAHTRTLGREVVPQRLFVTSFREAGIPEMALVHMAFESGIMTDPKLDIPSGIQRILQPYIASIKAGLEETLDVQDAVDRIVDANKDKWVEVYSPSGISRTGLAIPPQILSGNGIARDDIKNLVNTAENASSTPGKVKLRFGGPNGNKITVSPATGLEEGPLDLQLPDQFLSFPSVLQGIQSAIQTSTFLQIIAQVLHIAPGIPSGYRQLTTAERQALARNRVRPENWDWVLVPEDFGREDIARMFGVQLRGHVQLGLLRGTVAFDEAGKEVPAAIENTILADVVVGNNVLIRNNDLISRYVIGDGAIVTRNGELTAEAGTTFGLGAAIPVGPEVGGREVKIYPEMSFGAVVRLARSRGDRVSQDAYAKEHDRYVQAAKSDYGYIGPQTQVSGVGRGKNLFIAGRAQFIEVPTAENVILLSGPEDLITMGKVTDSPKLQESEKTRVIGANQLFNVILQPGVEVKSGAVVIGTSRENGVLLLEHSHAENQATVKDSVIAPNTGVEKGEATSTLLGPFIGMHHSSIVIAVDWAEGMGNVGAEAAIGSNHTSRLPDQELRAGEGTFFGLNSSYSFSGNYTEAPYSIWAKGVSVLPQRMKMPFSLVAKPSVQIQGLSPELMEIFPNWVWSDNAYMPLRNEGKYASRDKAKRHSLGMDDLRRTPYEILRPSVVNQMIRARDVLKNADPEKAFEGSILDKDGKPKPIRYYTDRQIPDLGKNYMTEESRKTALDSYTAMIQYYALRGLLAEVQRLVSEGRKTEVGTLLTTPSDNLRWEHERRVLLAELPGIAIPTALQRLADMQDQLAKQVRDSKEKDDKRGERILDDYKEVHTPADQDKFVKQSAQAAQQLRLQVDALVPQLAGLEEQSTVAAPTIAAQTGVATAPTGVVPLIQTVEDLLVELYSIPIVEVTEDTVRSKGLIVTPDGLSKLSLAVALTGPNKQPLVIEALANNAEHQKHVQSVLEKLGLTSVRVYDLQTDFQGDLNAAVRELGRRQTEQGRQTRVVRASTPLTELLEFLGIPNAISLLKGIEAIIERSQAIWA